MCCLVANVLLVGLSPATNRARVDVLAAHLYAGGASVLAAAEEVAARCECLHPDASIVDVVEERERAEGCVEHGKA